MTVRIGRKLKPLSFDSIKSVFKDPTIDEDALFNRDFAEQTAFSLRVTMPLTCFVQALMTVLDYHLYPEDISKFIIYHVLVISGCLFLFATGYFQYLRQYVEPSVTAVWLFALIAVSILLCSVHNGLYNYNGGYILTMLYVCGFVRVRFIRALLCCLAAPLIFNVNMYFTDQSTLTILYVNFWIFLTGIVGLSSSFVIEQLEKKKFILQKQLRREKESSEGHSAWLRQLALFLRHEVRQPIAQINSSIELSALKRPDDPSRNGHLCDAAVAAQQVWHLIDRASRATDAEAFVRQARSESVELRGLLAGLVQSFAQTYSGVGFQLAPSASVTAEADPVLLKEAVSNLLSNAASFADEETKVEVTLEVQDQAAEIRVRNQGPSLKDDTEKLFQPFISSRSGSTSEHHGLGLYLVRLIAQQHGGTATINNIADGTGVEASLRLPLTADSG